MGLNKEENIELLSCDGSGRRIVAVLNEMALPTHGEEPIKRSLQESGNTETSELTFGGVLSNFQLEGPISKPEASIVIVYNSYDDSINGCYKFIGYTDNPAGHYYVTKNQIPFSDCTSCNQVLGLVKLSNPDTQKEYENARRYLNDIIKNKNQQ